MKPLTFFIENEYYDIDRLYNFQYKDFANYNSSDLEKYWLDDYKY